MKAVVCHEHNKITVEEVTLDAPQAGEVKVKNVAAGVCHSDLSATNGTMPLPLPLVLGHEGAGIVEEVGSEVTYLAKGDHVIGCLSAFCGHCEFCLRGEPNLCGGEATGRAPDAPPRIRKGGETIHQFFTSLLKNRLRSVMSLLEKMKQKLNLINSLVRWTAIHLN